MKAVQRAPCCQEGSAKRGWLLPARLYHGQSARCELQSGPRVKFLWRNIYFSDFRWYSLKATIRANERSRATVPGLQPAREDDIYFCTFRLRLRFASHRSHSSLLAGHSPTHHQLASQGAGKTRACPSLWPGMRGGRCQVHLMLRLRQR